MPVWLVTGGTGFLGRHLLAALGDRKPADVQIVVTGRRPPAGNSDLRFCPVDLADFEPLEHVIRALNPSVVFHLAGRTPPAAPGDFYRGNTLATVHLLDALRAGGRPVRVILAGSAAELGPVGVEYLPVHEDHPCRPSGAYGLSKWLATAAGLAAGPPLEVVVARIFNPVGPALPESQAFGRFAALLAEPGPNPLPMAVGDLDTRRDFIDARDVARALIALALRGHPGLVYHVGTGHSHQVGDGLDLLIRLSGRRVVLNVDARGRGPGDSRADNRRIRRHTGWSPEISWEQSLADLWRAVAVDRPREGRIIRAGREKKTLPQRHGGHED